MLATLSRGRWVKKCCVISSVIFNSLCPSDAIWWRRSGSTLAQVMACCLAAPIHYLSLRWLLFSEVMWQSPESNSTISSQVVGYRQTSNIRWTKSQHLNASLTLQFSLSNPLKPGVKSRMNMWLEQRWALLQLHLSDQQFYSPLRCILYQRFDSIQIL